ncbi:hypothetical protein GCM10009615_11480 [Corynebacterium durum]
MYPQCGEQGYAVPGERRWDDVDLYGLKIIENEHHGDGADKNRNQRCYDG